MDMVDPQPTLVELLVRHVLLPCALLPQIEINSLDDAHLISPEGHYWLQQGDPCWQIPTRHEERLEWLVGLGLQPQVVTVRR